MSLQHSHSIFESNLYTPEAVAKKLAVTTRSVRKWLRTKKLRGVKIGRLWRIRPDDLAEFIDPVAHLLKTARVDHSPMSSDEIEAIKQAEEDIKHGRVTTLSRNADELDV